MVTTASRLRRLITNLLDLAHVRDLANGAGQEQKQPGGFLHFYGVQPAFSSHEARFLQKKLACCESASCPKKMQLLDAL